MGMFVGYYVKGNVCFFFGLDRVFMVAGIWPVMEGISAVYHGKGGRKCHKCSIP